MNMIENTLYLGIGGFLGSTGRYWTQYLLNKAIGNTFPYGTLAVNLIGSFLIGFLMILLTKPGLSHPGFRLFFIVGLMGGYTTYSSFSYDNLKLIQDGRFFDSMLYTIVTFLPGLVLVWAGTLVGKITLEMLKGD